MSIDPQLLITGSLIAIAGTLVVQLRQLPSIIYKRIKRKFVYTVTIYQSDELFDHVEAWMRTNYVQQYKDVEATIYKDGDETCEIRYKQEDNIFIMKHGGKRILVNKGKEKLDKAQNIKEIYYRRYTLSGFRAKKQISKVLDEAVNMANNNVNANSIRVYHSNSYGDWYNRGAMRVKKIENIILPSGMKESFIDDVVEFTESEQWYNDVSIPYKRGYCLYGPPGTGKTTLTLALSNFIKRDIYCLSINSLMGDNYLQSAFNNLPKKSILLIEDIDKVFSGRENTNKDCKVSFSSLLNCMDGAFYKEGVITIITTNHIEKLDPALIRTGRIDIKLEVGLPTEKEISKYLTLFYQKDIQIKGNFDFKMSDIQEICLSNKNNSDNAIKQIYEKDKNFEPAYN